MSTNEKPVAATTGRQAFLNGPSNQTFKNTIDPTWRQVVYTREVLGGTYPYYDEDGRLIAIRKDYIQTLYLADGKRIESERYEVTPDDTRLPLYNLPAVRCANRKQLPVLLVCNEKQAETITRYLLNCIGSLPIAVSTYRGWNARLSESLRGARVFVLVERDGTGKATAQHVKRDLWGIASVVKVIPLSIILDVIRSTPKRSQGIRDSVAGLKSFPTSKPGTSAVTDRGKINVEGTNL